MRVKVTTMRLYKNLHAKERGVALITVVLMSFLVIGLITLALTTGMMGNVLTSAYNTERASMQCAQGDIERANQLLQMASSGNLDSSQSLDIVLNPDFIAEIASSSLLLAAADAFDNGPDITIGASANRPNCITAIDIDYLYTRDARPGEPANQGLWGSAVAGTRCFDGNVFSVIAVTANQAAGMQSTVQSAFYQCPG